MSNATTQERVFELVGISEVDAHIAAYAGHPAVQASIEHAARTSGSVAEAMERIEPFVHSSNSTAPLMYSERYSQEFGCSVYFKDETELSVGSFKLRGALNKVLSLSVDERANGIVTVSAGNHAQGVAKAAQVVGSQATVFMPRSTPAGKIAAVESLGASVQLVGQSFEEAGEACTQYLQAHPEQTFVHPFDDEKVIAGQGTVGHEIYAALAEDNMVPTHMFVPVGGGGLLSGTFLASQEAGSFTELHGVEPLQSAAYNRSIRLGERVCLESVKTHAEGAAVAQMGSLAYDLLAHAPNVSPMVVTEEALVADMVELNDHFQKPIECTGVLAFSGLRAHHEQHGFSTHDVVVAIMSGKHRNEATYSHLKATLSDRTNRLTSVS